VGETTPDVRDFEASIEARVEPDAVGQIAFDLLRQLYPFVKRNVDEIPYLTDAEDAVDSSKFSA
jgi:hypothetical protein